MRRIVITWLVILAAIYIGWLLVLYIMQDSMLFPRHLAGPAMEGPARGVESIWIDTEAGKVEAWFIPALEPGAPLLVFLHGNGELIDGCLDVAHEWRARGYNVLIPEYRGYGRSAGRPGETAIVADALRFIGLAAQRPGVDGTRIVLHGRSIGGAVAAQVAVRMPAPPSALILQSTITSVSDFGAKLLAPRWLVRNPFRTDRALAGYDRPTLILHGTEDEIVPVSQARRLKEIVAGCEYVELPGRHNDFPLDEIAYWKAIDGFLARHVPAGR